VAGHHPVRTALSSLVRLSALPYDSSSLKWSVPGGHSTDKAILGSTEAARAGPAVARTRGRP
jgi:hypothetical protein